MLKFIEKLPGQWITFFVGGAAFIYIVGKSNVSPFTTNLSDQTVGLGMKTIPGGVGGFVTALAAAGAFLNKEQFGKLS